MSYISRHSQHSPVTSSRPSTPSENSSSLSKGLKSLVSKLQTELHKEIRTPKETVESTHSYHNRELKPLINEYQVKPKQKTQQEASSHQVMQFTSLAMSDHGMDKTGSFNPTVPDTINIVQDNAFPRFPISSGDKLTNDKAVQAESKSNKALYAQLLAGSLSAILGAVLVAVAKTHQEGSDQSVDGIGDVAEPDYATEAERAADAAEQAWRNEFMDPDVWGKGHVDKDGVSDVTGTTNPNFVIDYGSDINNPQYTTTLTDEGKAALAEIRDKAATQRMSELKEEYQNEVAERQAYNEGLKDINAGGREGADHDAMVGIGATLIGLGTLSTMLLAGNRHVKHSHQKQAESGNPAQHGAFVRGFEQNILRVKA
jgi:hypothetical protein